MPRDRGKCCRTCEPWLCQGVRAGQMHAGQRRSYAEAKAISCRPQATGSEIQAQDQSKLVPGAFRSTNNRSCDQPGWGKGRGAGIRRKFCFPLDKVAEVQAFILMLINLPSVSFLFYRSSPLLSRRVLYEALMLGPRAKAPMSLRAHGGKGP